MDGKLRDPFFVTGGGSGGIHPVGTEVKAGAGLASDLNSCDTSDHRRPRSNPLPLPSDRRNFFSSGREEYTLSARQDVRTADDANCLSHRRLCFRSEPIHDLHVATLRAIDPTGVYGMYQEWSNMKNRVLSGIAGGYAEQRSDLALYDRLHKEAEDDRASSDDDASIANAVVASGTIMEQAYRTRSPSSGLLCEYLTRSSGLFSLVVKSCGMSALASAEIMVAVATNTTLKTLNLSGNNMGGTSDLIASHHHQQQGSAASAGVGGSRGEVGVADRLTGGASVALALDSNNSLTYLDLSWNKALRWLSLAGNRLGDQGAFSLGGALGVNCSLTHLDVSFNGISCPGAAALGHGLRGNTAIKNLQALKSMMTAIVTKTGLTPGVDLMTLRPFVQSGRLMSTAPVAATPTPSSDNEGGPFDLDLCNASERAAAQDILFAGSYLTGCRLAEVRNLQLVRPSPDAAVLQPRGIFVNGTEGEGSLQGDVPLEFCARSYSDQQTTLAALSVRVDGEHEAWPLPTKGRLKGLVEFIPLPPCMASVCNATGLRGLLAAMNGCFDARVEAFRLFVADLFMTTNQLAGGPNALNSAEMLKIMAAVSPQTYPAFTGGVSGPFLLDLRFSRHRLAAVRLAEAENFQTRNVRYRPARAAAAASRAGEDEEVDGGGADDMSDEGASAVANKNSIGDENSVTAPACVAHNGLREPAAKFFQHGLRDKPTGVLELDFVCLSRPPEGMQPISDLRLARLLNSCGMLDPNYWGSSLYSVDVAQSSAVPLLVGVLHEKQSLQRSPEERGRLSPVFVDRSDGEEMSRTTRVQLQPITHQLLAKIPMPHSSNNRSPHQPLSRSEYMRPTSFPVSFVDLIRLLRVKGRGDKRQAKILVLLLRVKNSMLRVPRVARPRQGEESIPINPQPGRLEGGVIAKISPDVTSSSPCSTKPRQTTRPPTKTDQYQLILVAQGMTSIRRIRYRIGGTASAIVGSTSPTPTLASTVVSATSRSLKKTATSVPAAAATGHYSSVTSPEVGPASGKGDRVDGGVSPPEHSNPSRRDETSVRTAAASGAADDSLAKDKHHGSEERKQVARAAEEELTPVQAAVMAVDKRLQDLLIAGGILRGTTSGRECLQGFPRGTPVWENHCGRVGGRDEGSGGRRVDGANDIVGDEDAAGGAMGWARKFFGVDDGRFPSDESGEGIALGKVLAKHVVRDGDVGLIGTSPPTLLVHGLCIRVRHGESNRVLRVKRRPPASGHGEDNAKRHQDEWAAVARQGVQGCRLRIGTKREVASALAATFAGLTTEPNLVSIAATPRTLGTLDMTTDKGWRELFVPLELSASTAVSEAGPLQLTLLVTFVEVSAQFLPSDCFVSSEFTTVDHQGTVTFEWVPLEETTEAATVAAVVPRVLGV
ncbi:unnamed protein product [Ectocarpus sp. CCAP 1310/34]|nr:unnamed protein product [Ectocarpus sp. CCAP 1310/34]